MIVRLMGGLANQMFHYAFGRSVASAHGEELKFTHTFFNLGPEDGLLRRFCYCLDAFNITVTAKAPAESGRRIEDKVFGQFQPSVFTEAPGASYIGPWQSEKYFTHPWVFQAAGRAGYIYDIENIIRREFTLREEPSDESKRIADQIMSVGPRSMFLHIRRGDYLIGPNPEFHGAPTLNYYREAAKKMKEHYENAKFFVFSDDPEYCKQNFPHVNLSGPYGSSESSFTVVDHNKPSDGITPGREHEDIWLMSLCHNAAIANSSFSWWGAWLGDTKENRLVFAPERWLGANNKMMVGPDLIPERWIKLAN